MIFALVPFALWIVALVQIGGSRATVSATVVWVVIVTLVPLIGAIVWFAVGRRSVSQAPPTARE